MFEHEAEVVSVISRFRDVAAHGESLVRVYVNYAKREE
jgi:hypothetical protein